MAKNITIGIQSFEELIEKKCFYIDKTDFIKEWWDSNDSVTLITRPRRFGKTLNMSMLNRFFSVEYEGQGEIFNGLSIWKEEKYRNIQGTYPVINLSFANIKEKDYESTRKKICQILTKLYAKYSFLLDGRLLDEKEKSLFKRIAEDMDDVDATMALYNLSDFLCRYYGKKVIILLDEYDTPMQEAYINGFWDELAVFTRSMFNATFKTNPYLERGIMTGITRVSKESIFSDLNNLKVVTTTANEYATAFGFTEQEVFLALDEYGLGEQKDRVKEWYDGFIFGEHKEIYNPWSILNFLDTNGKYETYWANTSGNRLVGKLLREGNRRIKQSFEVLLKGESIRCTIDEQIVYNMLGDNETAVFSLLLASGYLKVLSYERFQDLTVEQRPRYELMLTNGEVRRMFYSMVHDWFLDVETDYNDFVAAMLCGDLEAMNEYMNRVARDVFSYFDTGRKSAEEPERFYHGFVLGLMAELGDQYAITSNRESGFGRYDVMLEPLDKSRNALIMEFKVHNPRKEKSLEETVEVALKQIEDKQYEASLVQKGFKKEQICKYGFAFKGKEVLIGERL